MRKRGGRRSRGAMAKKPARNRFVEMESASGRWGKVPERGLKASVPKMTITQVIRKKATSAGSDVTPSPSHITASQPADLTIVSVLNLTPSTSSATFNSKPTPPCITPIQTEETPMSDEEEEMIAFFLQHNPNLSRDVYQTLLADPAMDQAAELCYETITHVDSLRLARPEDDFVDLRDTRNPDRPVASFSQALLRRYYTPHGYRGWLRCVTCDELLKTESQVQHHVIGHLVESFGTTKGPGEVAGGTGGLMGRFSGGKNLGMVDGIVRGNVADDGMESGKESSGSDVEELSRQSDRTVGSVDPITVASGSSSSLPSTASSSSGPSSSAETEITWKSIFKLPSAKTTESSGSHLKEGFRYFQKRQQNSQRPRKNRPAPVVGTAHEEWAKLTLREKKRYQDQAMLQERLRNEIMQEWKLDSGKMNKQAVRAVSGELRHRLYFAIHGRKHSALQANLKVHQERSEQRRLLAVSTDAPSQYK